MVMQLKLDALSYRYRFAASHQLCSRRTRFVSQLLSPEATLVARAKGRS
jgi:hypothetical protein